MIIICPNTKRANQEEYMEQKNTKILNERVSTTLTTSDFYYDLPEELIAQSPSEERDGCRLMVLDREKKEISMAIKNRKHNYPLY